MTDMFVLKEDDQASGGNQGRGAWASVDDNTVLEAVVEDIQKITKPFNDDELVNNVRRLV